MKKKLKIIIINNCDKRLKCGNIDCSSIGCKSKERLACFNYNCDFYCPIHSRNCAYDENEINVCKFYKNFMDGLKILNKKEIVTLDFGE